MNRQLSLLRSVGLLSSMFAAFAGWQSTAQAQTWNQTAAGTYSWNTAGNWSPSTVPNGTSAITIFGTIAGNNVITLDAAITVNSMTFNNSTAATNYTFNPGTGGLLTFDGTNPAITQNGTAAINFDSALGVVLNANTTINGSGTGLVSIAGSLTGIASLTLNFTGTTAGSVTLSGANGSWTGNTTVNRGTLSLDFANNNTNKINAAGTLTLGNATLLINGNSGSATAQTVAIMNLNPGLLTIGITANGGQTANLTGTSVVRASGSLLSLTLTNASTFTATALTSNGVSPTNGDTLGWAIVGGNQFGLWSVGSIIANTTETANDAVGTWTNANITNSATGPYAGTTTAGAVTINSLKFTGTSATAGGVIIGTLATDKLVIGTGGILLTSTLGAAATISSPLGNITTAAITTDLAITNNSTKTLTISAAIGAVGAAPAALDYTTTNTTTNSLTVSGFNFISGGLFINSGITTFSAGAAAVATTPLALNNSAAAQANPLGFSGAAGTASTVTLGNGATLNLSLFTGTEATATALTLGNAIVVPYGTATVKIDRGAATITGSKSLAFGNMTLGDGVTLNWNTNTVVAVAAGYNPSVTGLTLSAGNGNQPTTQTISISGGTGTGGSNVSYTTSGISVGSTGGATLNIIGTNAGTLTNPGFNINGATTGTLSAINMTGTARVFLSNVTGITGATAFSVGSGTILTANIANVNLTTNAVTVASGGGLASRLATFTVSTTGLPANGILNLQNDLASTAALSLSGNYTLNGSLTVNISGNLFQTAANVIGATTLSGNLDATAAASPVTLTFNYSPGVTSTGTAATTTLFTVSGNLAIGTNVTNLTTGGGSTGATIQIGNITGTTGSIVKLGAGTVIDTGTTSAFSGGTTVTAGTFRVTTSDTATTTITGGPFGTGTVNLNGGTLQDNGAARTFHNNLSVTVSSATTTTGAATVAPNSIQAGSITFTDAGLGTATTTTITNGITWTVTNVTTIDQAAGITGAGNFTKVGSGILNIRGPLTGNATGTITVSAGELILSNTAAYNGLISVSSGAYLNLAGTGALSLAAPITVASGGVLILNPVSQAIVNQVVTTSAGVIAIGADSNASLNLSAFASARFGSAPSGYVYTGTITAPGNILRVGPGGGVLYFASPIGSPITSIDVGTNSTTVGDTYLTNASNSFTGGVTIGAAANLSIKSDAALGNGGTVTFNGAGASLTLFAPTSATTLTHTVNVANAGTIDNGGNALSLNSTISGAGALSLAGNGTFTILTAITTSGTVSLNAPTTTALTGAPFGTGNFVQDGNLTLTAVGAYTLGNAGAKTYTYNGGTLSAGVLSTGGTTVVLGGTGASFLRGTTTTVNPTITAQPSGLLILAPANGTATLGTAGGETFTVGGTTPTLTSGIVASVFGRNNDANGTGTFLNYTASGFVPATYGIVNSFGAAVNVDVTAVQTLTTATAANALRTNANIAINPSVLNTSIALTVGTGGLILTGNPTISQTANGTGVGQLAFGAADGKIYTDTAGATISAIITGTGGLSIVGPGALTLSGLNTFTGAIVINGGTLSFAGFTDTVTTTTGTPLGAGGNRVTVLDNGGTLRLASGTFNPVALGRMTQIGAGGGVFDVRSAAILQLDDANQLASVSGTAGTLTITNGGTGIGTVFVNSQNYAVNGPIIVGSSTGTAILQYGAAAAANLTSTLGNSLESALYLNTGGQFDVRSTVAWSRPIIFNGGSIVSGAASTNTITGTIYVAGSLGGSINNANALVIGSEIILDGGGLVLAGAGTFTQNAPIVGGGSSLNPGGLTNSGTFGVFYNRSFTARTDNTYSGGTSIQSGISLTINTDGSLGTAPLTPTLNLAINGGTLIVGANLTLDANRTIALGATNAVTVNGTINVGTGFTATIAGNITNQGSGTGGFIKTGLGTLNLGGAADSYNGITQVQAGILRANATNAVTATNATGVDVTATGAGVTATFDINGVSQTLLALNLGGSTATSIPQVTGTGTLVLNGNATYTSTNNPLGGLISVATLDLNAATRTFTVGDSTTAATDLTLSSLVQNGGLLKAGAGFMVLSNAGNTYAGGTSITAGTLSIADDGALGNTSGGLSINAATLQITGTTDTALAATRTLTLPGASTFNILAAANNYTVSQSATTAGIITKTGPGALTLGGTITTTANIVVSGGTLNVSGTISGSTTTTTLSYGATAATTVVNVTGNVTLFRTQGANVANSVAVLNLAAGSVTQTSQANSDMFVASNSGAGAYGYLNITGGTFKVISGAANSGRINLSGTTNAVNAGTTGVIFIGGTNAKLDQTSGEWLLNYGLGSITVASGGTLDRTGANAKWGLFMDSASGVSYGILNVAGGNVLAGAQAITLGNGNAPNTTGYVNLASGTLSLGASTVLSIGTGTGVNTYFNFAGGTLRATASITPMPASNANLTIYATTATIFGAIDNSAISGAPSFNGGLTVDSNGNTVTIANPLLAASGSGVTQANLSVTGGSGYVGAPAVKFSTTGVVAGGTPASGYALISGGAVIGIVITDPGTYTAGTVPSITLVGGGGSGALITASALNTANSTTGGITKIGVGTLSLSGANTFNGPVTISGTTTSILNITTAGALGTGTGAANLVIDGGLLQYTQNSSLTIARDTR